jgi:mRNA interferase MazF
VVDLEDLSHHRRNLVHERAEVLLAEREREVWWCELAEIGRRTVVVLSRDAAIQRPRDTYPRAPERGRPRTRRRPDPPSLGRQPRLGREGSVGVLVERLGRLADAACEKSAASSRLRSTAKADTAVEPSLSG